MLTRAPFATRLVLVASQLGCLVVAAVALLVEAGRAGRTGGGSPWEPLLNGIHDEEYGGGGEMGKRWQLVYGVCNYVWPDSRRLQLR